MRAEDKILVSETLADTPAEFLEDGGLYLDLNDDFSFDLNEKASELNNINELKESGVLGFSLPYTAKNLFVFAKYMSPNTLNQTFEALEIRALAGGSKALRQTNLLFKKASDKNRQIEVELVDPESYWIKGAQELALADIDTLGSFTLNYANLRSNWVLGLSYIEGLDNTVAFPLLHRGGWLRRDDFDFGGVAPDDFYPVYSVPALIKHGFKKLGYEADGPLFDWPDFNRWWAWLGEADIRYANKGERFHYEGASTADLDVVGLIDTPSQNNGYLAFQNEISDPNDSHFIDPAFAFNDVSKFINTTFAPSNFIAVIEGQVFNPNAFDVRFNVNVANWNSNNVLANANAITTKAGETTDFRVEFEFNLDYGQEAFFFINGVYGSGAGLWTIRFLTGLRIEVRPSSSRVYRDDTFNVHELINSDYLFIDFLKGVVHTGAFKLQTNIEEGKVYFYPPENIKVEADDYELEGYIKPPSNDIDLTDNVVPESREVIPPDEINKRYIRLRWKESTDPYITDVLNIDKEKGLWSRDVDLGVGDDKEVEVLENPFFEPTGSIMWNRLELPALWDNNEGRISTDMAPRLLYGVGYVRQVDGPDQNNVIGWEFDFQDEEDVPWAIQLPTHPYDRGLGFELPDRGIIYGAGEDTTLDLFYDLYTLFWQFELRLMISTVLFEFLVSVDQRLFNRMTFRERLFFTYGGRPYLVRLLEKKSFLTSKEVPMSIIVRPGFKYLGDIKSKGVIKEQEFEQINIV